MAAAFVYRALDKPDTTVLGEQEAMIFSMKRFSLMAIVILSLMSSSTFARQAVSIAADGDRPACAATYDATPAGSADEDDRPAWQTTALTDVRTGAEFVIDDFRGCAIYIEPMATWCINCKMQLENVAEAVPQLDGDRHVIIALSVETDLSPEDLKEYADNSGYDWVFAVASPEMLKAIVDEFGRNAIVPPSTPHFYVFPDGTYSELETGGEDAASIVETMNQARGT